MTSIKIAVVEDEMIIANHINDLLGQMGYEVMDPCVTYGEAIELLESEQPDLVLLDIHLAGKKTGLDVAQVINEKFNIPFIFLTSYSDQKTLDKVKELHPSAYLVKPFKKEDLFTSIELAIHNYLERKQERTSQKTHRDSFFVKHNGHFHRINFDDILFVKSDHIYLEIFTNDGKKFLHRSTIASILNLLPPNLLFQIHRSYLISVPWIGSFDARHVKIRDYEIPIGRKYKQVLLDKLNIVG